MPKSPPKGEGQIDKFRQLARELETDNDETRFDERLKRLATAPREPKPAPKAVKPK
jgi:hypothetical protein